MVKVSPVPVHCAMKSHGGSVFTNTVLISIQYSCGHFNFTNACL